MTLNVSLRVPDGIVLASDSLSTVSQSITQQINAEAKCEKCGNQVEIKGIKAPPMTVPSSTFPFAQKLFPVIGMFGLAVHGSGFVNGRSIYNHIIELDPKLPRAGENLFDEVAAKIVEYFKNQLLIEWKTAGVKEDLQPETFRPFGFQLVGFAKDKNGDPAAQTRVIRVGKAPTIEPQNDIGSTVSGDTSVVRLLWPKGDTGANYAAFSLQDAIDYAAFLIKTTADYQRFSGKMPTVGGEIDIALITNHLGFRWIAQKKLYRILEKEVSGA